MKSLSEEIILILRAAEGWLELGDFTSASDELEKLPFDSRNYWEVLHIRCRIYRKAKRWKTLEILAQSCTEIYPNVLIFWSEYARSVHQQGETQKAVTLLESVKDRFSTSEGLAYNLALYLTLMDRLAEAQDWLAKAFELAEDPMKLKLIALDQPEFEKLWSMDANEE